MCSDEERQVLQRAIKHGPKLEREELAKYCMRLYKEVTGRDPKDDAERYMKWWRENHDPVTKETTYIW